MSNKVDFTANGFGDKEGRVVESIPTLNMNLKIQYLLRIQLQSAFDADALQICLKSIDKNFSKRYNRDIR